MMLCVGFLFLITTANSYGVLWQELDTPYVLPGTVTGQADLEKYLEVPSVEAVTPVLSFETKLTAKDAALSGTVTAVLADYLELSFAQGSPFPNDTNMPFLVLNEYASKNFLTESKSKVTLAINDTLTMTIGEEEQSASLCGIFQDGLEQPVIYMSYALAAQKLPKEDNIRLLFRLRKTEDLESGAKALRKLGVSCFLRRRSAGTLETDKAADIPNLSVCYCSLDLFCRPDNGAAQARANGSLI